MDTMKLLLGATVALLLGALAVSWQGMKTGVANTSQDEIARLKKQIAEINMVQENLMIQRRLQDLKSLPDANSAPATNPEVEAINAQLEASKAALALIEAEKAQRDAKVAQDEEGLLSQLDLERGDTELRRARMIANALLIGRVSEYIEDAESGGFITLEVLMPEQVEVGTILAIRRKTGILGQLKVSSVEAEGAIAYPMPGFGPVQPAVGDELILPPQY